MIIVFVSSSFLNLSFVCIEQLRLSSALLGHVAILNRVQCLGRLVDSQANI